MKLFRYGPVGAELPAVELNSGKRLSVADFGEDFNESFFETDGINRLKSWIEAQADNLEEIPSGERFGPCVGRPSKIICIGLNYVDHAKESNMAIPAEPIVFFKSTTSIVGPNDDLMIPKGSEKTDWEVELAVVIGRKASYVSKEEAMDYVAGFSLHNDYSERAFQLERGGQWVKGKSCDTFAPLGPYMVPKEEVADFRNMGLWLKVNGEIKQNGNTNNMIFDVPFLVSYLSEFMTLLPGDVISTGTPAGVGLGFNPPQYLKPGDVVELGIDGLGQSSQKAIAFKK